MEEEINQVVQQVDEGQIISLSTCPVNDEKWLTFIKDTSVIVSKVYDNLTDRFSNSELLSFQNRVSQLPYTLYNEMHRNIAQWAVGRADLISTVKSTADQLDQSYKLATIGTIIGSAIDLFHNIDSICGNSISDELLQGVYSVSTKLGIASQVFLKFVPYFGYMGLVSWFGDAANTKIKMLGVKGVILKDMELYENIKRWLQETETLDGEVKKLFPYGMDCDVLLEVENILSFSDCCTKVFAVALYSNIKKFPFLMKSVNFICEAFIFSRSEAGAEWYKRILAVQHPIRFEANQLKMKNELFEIMKSFPEVRINMANLVPKEETEVGNSEQNKNIFILKGEHIAHTIQGLVNCFSIYMSYKDLNEGIKNKHSDWLRELARKSQICLDHIIDVQRRLEKTYGRTIEENK